MFIYVFCIERRVTYAIHWFFRFLKPIMRDFPLQIVLARFRWNLCRVAQPSPDLSDVYNQSRLIRLLWLAMLYLHFRLVPKRIADSF